MFKLLLPLLIVFFPLFGGVEALYLTWFEDPTSSMVISWITEKGEEESSIFLSEEGTEELEIVQGELTVLPEGVEDYVLHRVELQGLKPDTRYKFTILGEDKRHVFSTLPLEVKHPITAVVGGDIYKNDLEMLKKMCREAALTSPDFALLGGDIAYSTKGLVEVPDNFTCWLEFLKGWEEMVTPDGRIIPLFATIGNTDTKGSQLQPKSNAPFFYTLFCKEEQLTPLDIGSFLTVIRLDTGHTSYLEEEAERLEELLTLRKETLHKVLLYHIPAFPSYRSFNYPWSLAVRTSWVPIFEKHEISVAFEHHDHCYKRTQYLNGVLYIGDGGWAVGKTLHPKTAQERPYLATSHKGRHFIKATFFPNGERLYEAIDEEGKRFDLFLDDRYTQGK